MFPQFKSKTLLIDTETSGLDVHFGHRICGIAIGDYQHPEIKAFLPIRMTSGNLPLEETLAWLRKLAADPSYAWVGHNLKFDLQMFRADGITFAGQIVDTMVAAHLVKGNLNSYALDFLTKVYCKGFKHVWYEKLEEWLNKNQPRMELGEGKSPRNYSLVPLELLAPYALEDIEATRLLCNALNEKFREILSHKEFATYDNHGCASGSLKTLHINEKRLVPVLADMEYRGMKVDLHRAVELREKARGEIENYTRELTELAGFSFNPAAYTEMTKALEACGGKVMFWMRPEENRGKQKTEKFTDNYDESTKRPCFNAAAVLQYLMRFERGSKPWRFMLAYHEILARQFALGLYVETIIKRADFNLRLHGSFNQTTVITGRLSSSGPNFQNFAKTKGTNDQKAFEKAVGIKNEDALNRQIRGLFIAGKPGNVLVSCDMSQAEYRAAVWLSQDEEMIAKWRANPSLDYHQDTMDLTGLDRDCCKTINFLILYGGGAKGLAATLTMMGKPTSITQAQQMINTVLSARPALRRLMSDTVQFCNANRFVINPMGRICDVPDGFAYKGLNYEVQGFVGDMMRIKLVDMAEYIKKNELPVEMLSSVHDEILFDMAAEDVERIAPLLAQELCRIPHLGVPMLSDIEVGYSWGAMKGLNEWLKERKAA